MTTEISKLNDAVQYALEKSRTRLFSSLDKIFPISDTDVFSHYPYTTPLSMASLLCKDELDSKIKGFTAALDGILNRKKDDDAANEAQVKDALAELKRAHSLQ